MASHEFPVAWSHAKFFLWCSLDSRRSEILKKKWNHWTGLTTTRPNDERRNWSSTIIFNFIPRGEENGRKCSRSCHRISALKPSAVGETNNVGAKKRQPQVSATRLIKNGDLCLVSKNRTRHRDFVAGSSQESRSLARSENASQRSLLNWNIFASLARLFIAFYLHLFLLRSFARLFASRARPRKNGWPKRRGKKKTKTHQGEANTNTINKWQRSELVRNVLKCALASLCCVSRAQRSAGTQIGDDVCAPTSEPGYRLRPYRDVNIVRGAKLVAIRDENV